MLLLVNSDGGAEVVDAATAEAIEQALSRQLETHAIDPDLAKVTKQLVRVRAAAVSVASRQEPTGAASPLASGDHDRVNREWLTIADAAAHWGVSRRTVERRVANGELRSRTFGRARRVHRADLKREDAA